MEALDKTVYIGSKKVTYYKIQISAYWITRFFLDDQIIHLYITQGLPAGAVLFSIQKDERLPDIYNLIFIENSHLLKYNTIIQHIELKPIFQDLDTGAWTNQEIEQLRKVIASRKDQNGPVLC